MLMVIHVKEETLVCLCKLFTTIGEKLEQYDKRKKKQNVAESFKKIQLISQSHPSSRIRFMMKVTSLHCKSSLFPISRTSSLAYGKS
jgi:hypothetical protein